MSLNNIRVGKSYFMRNFGETTSFLILESLNNNDFQIKDLLTLETYPLSQLIRYGFGNDFELKELD